MLQLDPKLLKKTGMFGLVSAELAAYVGAGLFLGRWLDQTFSMSPVGTSLCVVAGLTVAVFRIRVWFRREMAEEDSEQRSE